MGLSDKYKVPPASISEFGFTYDAAGRLTRTTVFASRIAAAALVGTNGQPTTVALSTLRPAVNAFDRSTWRLFDAAGRLVKTVDAAGAVVESVYDGAFRLVRQIAYARTIATAALGAAPAAAAVAPLADAAADRVTRFFHDGEGRVVGVLDAEGFLTESGYDAAGRLAPTTRYATRVPESARGAATLALSALNVR